MTTKENEPYTREVKIRILTLIWVTNVNSQESFQARFCDLEDRGFASRIEWFYDDDGIFSEAELFMWDEEFTELRLELRER